MGVQNPNSTAYVHPDEPNILNLHKAMEYNGLGQPIIRTVLGGGSGGIDAFGRMQVAQPYTLFDSQHRYAENDKFFTTVVSGGSTNHDANASLVNMAVAGNSGDKVTRETTRVFTYQPGKALEMFHTFTMSAALTGLRQRVGYFNDDNGVFLEQTNSTLYLVLRSKSSGSVVENRIAQSSWNGDTLNGTGASKITLDVSKSQIFYTDIEWLGVGSVRCGFIINGEFVVAHSFHHANLITGTYMTTATLPIRYEIENTASTGVTSTLKHICNTVISSGGFTPSGVSKTAGRGLTYYNLTTAGTYYHMVSIKLSSARLQDVAILTNIITLSSSNHNLQFKLVKNATFATPLTFTTGNTVDYSIGNSVVSAEGENILSGYVTLKASSGFTSEELNKIQLTRTSTADVYSVIVTADTNNSDASAIIGWMEPLRG